MGNAYAYTDQPHHARASRWSISASSTGAASSRHDTLADRFDTLSARKRRRTVLLTIGGIAVSLYVLAPFCVAAC